MKESDKISILIVDDRPENLLALESILDRPELSIIKAKSGNEALGLLLEHDFALVLLDVQMPEMDGFETAELMRVRERTRTIPIIFVTAISKEEKHIFKGYEAGAVDYLFKPIDSHILINKVNVFLDLYRQKHTLEKTMEHLRQTVGELKKANRKLIDQQKSVIEEERLKVLIQMAGATAHELSQPLMGLLGNIELMEMESDNPDNFRRHLDRVREAGHRISAIARKMQSIPHFETRSYQGNASSIINYDQKIKILYAEKSDEDFAAFQSLLSHHGQITLGRAKTLEESFALLKKNPMDLVFSDYFLPDGNGLDFIARMQGEEVDIPVVIITGKGDEMIASKVIQAGAYDYLPKSNLSDETLTRAIGNALEKARLRAEVKEAHQMMCDMATKDELTGLFNRRHFMEALNREVSRAGRSRDDLVLCMLDLDHFKAVNDTHGHLMGDEVLATFGRMLKDIIRLSDLVCRYGGEEFAVILPDSDIEKAKVASERFRKLMGKHIFKCRTGEFSITVSIGIASLFSSKDQSPEQLVQCADQALYRAKEMGRNRVVEFQSEE